MSCKNHSSSEYKASALNQESPTAPLQADYQALLMTPVATVFDAVADPERYGQLIPNLKQIQVKPSAQGVIRACDFGNDMILEERIVLWQPPTTYAYEVITPNPFGIWQHYALVTCKPYQDGTQLHWRHYFNHDDLAAMLAMLNRMFEQVFAKLLTQFKGRMLS